MKLSELESEYLSRIIRSDFDNINNDTVQTVTDTMYY